MKTSAQVDQLFKALAGAQKELKNPVADQTVKIPHKGRDTFHTYKYAPLPAVLDALREPFGNHGLSHSSSINGVLLDVTIMHESGQWMSSEVELPGSDDIKGYAGNITYLKRYLLNGLAGISADEDTDSSPTEASPPNDPPPVPSGNPSPIKPQGQAEKKTPVGHPVNSQTNAQRKQVIEACEKTKWTREQVKTLTQRVYKTDDPGALTTEQMTELLSTMESETFQMALDAFDLSAQQALGMGM